MANVLVPLAQGCEELEAITIIDLLRRARFNVTTASLTEEPVTACHGTTLMADKTLNAALKDKYDMIVLPGGLPGADHLKQDPRIQNLLRDMTQQGKYTCAICAAPRALASAGLLEGKRATSYPGTLDKMDIPGMTFVDTPVVVDDKIITSRGPGTAMDFALTLIEALGGKGLREEVETPLLRAR